MSEWITDRLPTKADVHADGRVWIMYEGDAVMCQFETVELGEPWQHIIRPEPYVKPKRWITRWDVHAHRWYIVGSLDRYIVASLELEKNQADAAQRIADIYNEVMP